MKIIRYVDIMGAENEVIQENFTVPMIIDPNRIEVIFPLFGANGKLFKNVSIIKYDQDAMKVVGNYRDLNELKDKGVQTPIGFLNGKQRQETIED